MNLPMSEGPRDGDYARYVEQLSGGGVPPAVPSTAPAAVSAAAPSAGAQATTPVNASGETADAVRQVFATAMRTRRKRPAAQLASFKVRLVARVFMLAMMLSVARMFSPRLMTPLLVLAVAWLIGTLIRDWARQHRG